MKQDNILSYVKVSKFYFGDNFYGSVTSTK